MAFVDEIGIGFAALLAEKLPEALVWRPSGYLDEADTRVALYVPVLPHDRDRAVALMPYPVEESVDGGSADIWAVQARIRGLPDDLLSVTGLEDDIFRAVQGLEHVKVGGIHATLIWRNSSIPMGQDVNRRHEWSSNFYMHVTRPTPHRAD